MSSLIGSHKFHQLHKSAFPSFYSTYWLKCIPLTLRKSQTKSCKSLSMEYLSELVNIFQYTVWENAVTSMNKNFKGVIAAVVLKIIFFVSQMHMALTIWISSGQMDPKLTKSEWKTMNYLSLLLFIQMPCKTFSNILTVSIM